jgi:hypothetical protein
LQRFIFGQRKHHPRLIAISRDHHRRLIFANSIDRTGEIFSGRAVGNRFRLDRILSNGPKSLATFLGAGDKRIISRLRCDKMPGNCGGIFVFGSALDVARASHAFVER